MADEPAIDLRATLVDLTPAVIGKDGYSARDRFVDLNATFSGRASAPQAQRALYAILEECGIHRLVYTAEPHEMYRFEGKREVGLVLLGWLTRDPTAELPTTAERTA